MFSLIAKCKAFVKWYIPSGIIKKHRERIRAKRLEDLYNQFPKAKEASDYFLSLDRNKQSIEIVEIIDYIKKHGISVFPYEIPNIKYRNIEIYFERDIKMCFILHEGKKMYFPEGWDTQRVLSYYKSLCIEQDAASPHRYETAEYTVQPGDVIADIGAAEGIWALAYADVASKIYLFECENDWIKALSKTFEPWKDKIEIVNKYISDRDGEKEICLDTFFKNKKINFIKADVEGAEVKLLKGGQSVLLKTYNLSLLLCVYHKQNDAEVINSILTGNGFRTEYSSRYMLFFFDDDIREPYVRRGLIRAKNKFSNRK